MVSMRDKVVFVTGASAGIGEACARVFAREGARLLLTARRIERLRELEPELLKLGASGVHSFALDVRSHKAVESAIDNLPKQWQAIDIGPSAGRPCAGWR